MSKIWKIRILALCVIAGAVYMGYGAWNNYLDRQEVLVGVSWEVPLSGDYGLWDYYIQQDEVRLNDIGLGLERQESVDADGHSKELLGVKNGEGRLIIPAVYNDVTVNLEESYICGDSSGYYNYDGTKLISAPIKGEVQWISGEYVFAKYGERGVILNRKGEAVLDLENISIKGIFDKDRGIFEFGNYDGSYNKEEYSTGLMDSSGKILLDAEYSEIFRASENRIYVRYAKTPAPKKEAFYLDNELKPISEKEYESISKFYEGVATVKDSTGWHIINENEEIIAPIPMALEVKPFAEGIAVAHYRGEYKYIDTAGRVLFSKQLFGGKEDMGIAGEEYSEGRITFIGKNKKLGFMDKEGNVIVEPTFDQTSYSTNGTAYVVIGSRGGVIRF